MEVILLQTESGDRPLSHISKHLSHNESPNDIIDVLSVIEASQVCVGNPDEKFLPLLKRHQQLLLNGDGKVPGLLNITLLFMEYAMYYRT